MAKIVLTLILSLVSLISSAQVIKNFFTIEGDLTDSIHSYYFNLSNPQEDFKTSANESFYSMSGSMRHKEDSIDDKGNSFKTFFHPNGNVKGKGHFSYYKPKGKFISYYENGNQQGEFIFLESNQLTPGIQIVNYWDSLNNKIVEQGKGNCNCWLEPYNDVITLESGMVENGFKTGLWKGHVKGEDISFEETYTFGNLVKGIQKNKSELYKYTHIVETAGPKDGIPSLMRYVTANTNYSRSARKNGIQGTVYIAFIVREDGSLGEFKMVKGIYKECDDEALRVVSSMPRFNNGTYRGKPIKMRMVLPIKFKLP